MALVTTVFTYTVAAGVGDKTPPPAPIRCGCDKLILLVDNKALLIASLNGILETTIREVAVSKAPVDFIDSVTGVSSKVWKYDYLLEYDSNNLTDPTYRIRKCDIAFNCCRGCAQEYTDRKVGNAIQSVTGTCVDNTDPRNPVVNGTRVVGTIVSQPDACTYLIDETVTQFNQGVGAQQNQLLYRDEDGNTTIVDLCPIVDRCVRGIDFCPIVTACLPPLNLSAGCALNISNNQININFSGAWGQGPLNFPCGEEFGSPIYCTGNSLRTVPPWTSIASANSNARTDAVPALTAVGQFARCDDAVSTITNPSPCRAMTGIMFATARIYGLITPGDFARVQATLFMDPGSGSFVGITQRRSFQQAGGPSNYNQDFIVNYQIPFTIPPGGGIILRAYAQVELLSISPGGRYAFDGGNSIIADITYMATNV